MFGNQGIIVPVNQPFMWVAEYLDGTCLSEFDQQTSNENSFYSIERDKLLRFGLVGSGSSMYFEVYGGIFKIVGQMIDVSYVTDSKTYQLTGRPAMYKDIISFKDAEFIFNPNVAGSGKSSITQFNFGYKTSFLIDEVMFHFQAICQIPKNEQARLEFKLVSSEDLDGRLEIKQNGRHVGTVDAPLVRDRGGAITWQLN